MRRELRDGRSLKRLLIGDRAFYAMVLAIVLVNILGDAAIGMTCLCIALPGLVVGLVILFTKTKETKGVDMGAIHGNEFEG